LKRWLWIIGLTAITIAGIVYGLRRQPVPVEAARVTVGPMQITVEEEGKTRLKTRYVISAPVAGHMTRIRWKEGDRIQSGGIVTVLAPPISALLDPRTREQGEARVRAAEAAAQVADARLRTAEEQVRAAQVDVDYWDRQKEREQPLVKSGDLPAARLDRTLAELARAEQALATAEAAVATARREAAAARAEVDAARAALRAANAPAAPAAEAVTVRAPAAGRVTRVIRESEGVVPAGQPLLEIGDANALEVGVELLSADAVRVAPGTRVLLTGWGGETPLEARVRVVEPSGFTKISALGVEEQRVRVIADITSPEELWRRLGDGYRVEASFVLWESGSVLQVPSNALFRAGSEWSVFVIEGGVARRRKVEVGRNNGLAAEILSGLREGETVVAHPDDTVEDGFRVVVR
jgi:HlyD family secretion protein